MNTNRQYTSHANVRTYTRAHHAYSTALTLKETATLIGFLVTNNIIEALLYRGATSSWVKGKLIARYSVSTCNSYVAIAPVRYLKLAT